MKIRIFFIVIIIFLMIFIPFTKAETYENTIAYEWSFYGQHFQLNIFVNGTEKSGVVHLYDSWELNIPIPLSSYMFYHHYPGGYRIGDNIRYLAYFVTPNDTYIEELAHMLDSIAKKNGWNRLTEANFILTFVQNVPYVDDFTSTGFIDYYKFPLETLFQRGGDCEDKAILLATILDILGYNSVLFVMHVEYKGTYGHVAVGLDVKNKSGPFAVYLKDYYSYNGVKYYYMESTGSESVITEGWTIKNIHYWVGISPTEAGAIIKNLSIVPINGPHYNGYYQKYDYVKDVKSRQEFPWYTLYVVLLVIVFLPFLLYSLRHEKKKCPACGYNLEKYHSYCPNCGYWLGAKSSSDRSKNEEKE